MDNPQCKDMNGHNPTKEINFLSTSKKWMFLSMQNTAAKKLGEIPDNTNNVTEREKKTVKSVQQSIKINSSAEELKKYSRKLQY